MYEQPIDLVGLHGAIQKERVESVDPFHEQHRAVAELDLVTTMRVLLAAFDIELRRDHALAVEDAAQQHRGVGRRVVTDGFRG